MSDSEDKPPVEKSAESYKYPGKAIDLNALRVFVVVADSGGFSSAGKKLGLPKWSVSRSVSGLEAAMGLPLLHRTTRRVTLSPAGAALHRRIAPLITSLDLASQDWREEMGEPAGDVHIAISSALQATASIGDAITKFINLYPAINVDVLFTDVSKEESAVEGFDISLVVGRAQMKDSSLIARRGWPIVSGFYTSPGYLATHGAPESLADLTSNHECILFSNVPTMYLEGPDGPTSFKPRGRIHCNDAYFARETIRSGAGIGLLPIFLAEPYIKTGRLIQLMPEYSFSEVFVYVIRPYTREVPLRVKLLSDFLYEYMRVNPLTTIE